VMVLAVTTGAKAYVYSGNDLLRDCEGADLSFCRGYFAGWGNTLYGLIEMTKGKQLICYPNSVTLEQAISIVVKYLHEHPEELHYTAESEMFMALIKVFPDPAALRLDQSFADTVGVKKLLTTVPVRKPNRQDFVRVHPDPAFRLTPACLLRIPSCLKSFFRVSSLTRPNILRSSAGNLSTVICIKTQK